MSRRTPGEGSISQRKDGLWQASLQVAGIRKVAYAKTEREVRQKLAELRKQAAVQGALPDPGKRTVDDLLDAWLEVSAPRWRPRTLQDWRYVCDVHLRPALGKVRLSRLTPERVQHHMASLEAQGHHRTALKVYRALSTACKLAVKWNWLAQNPCDRADAPCYRPGRKEVWTPQELRTFLRETEGHWLHPLWVYLLASGCRIGEALGLTWQDVDWSAGTVAIRRNLQRVGGEWLLQEPKTKAGVRTIALPPQGMAALRRQRVQQAEWRLRAGGKWHDPWGLVFIGRYGRPIGKGVVERNLKAQCQRLGLSYLTPHGLRHAHASLLVAGGMPIPAVSARLGHSNPAITMGVYSHALQGQDDAAAQAIGKVMSGRP
ncbi:MAG: tyrosine-type recombinase/integrase [Anaerolineae bacterium]